MSLENLELLLESMAKHLQRHLGDIKRDDVVMIGIHTGGVWVAERLHKLMDLPTPLGELNIAFYRDDFTRIGLHPHVKPSKLTSDIEHKHIILVDDVLHTGRTIRAAFNEIFDYGRPASISLAVLVERSGRELPIQPDVIGCALCLDAEQNVKLCGPEPLSLEIRTTHDS